jgi:AcrR family transcriptional regulator
MSTLPNRTTEEVYARGRGRPRDEVAKARILEAALELLEEQGFTNTTMDAVAERAGASKATIYRWWPNKAALLIESLRDEVAHELPFPDTDDLGEDIRVQLRNFVKLLTGRRGRVFKAFIAAAQNDLEVGSVFRSVWMKPRREEAKRVLEHHQDAGRLSRSLNLDLFLDLIYGPMYLRLLAGHDPLNAAFADSIADFALRGLA